MTTTAAASSLTSVSGNLTTFLKILTTQLQNQDPTAATDTNQFTQELVQFASAEQQINTNTKLDTLIKLGTASNSLNTTLGYINKYVSVTSDGTLPVQNGASEMSYTLDAAANEVKIAVKDSTGKVVATLNGVTTEGTNYVSWDGKDSSGNQLPDGDYKFSINATTPSGATVAVSNVKIFAKVTSVTTGDAGATNLGIGAKYTTTSTDIGGVYDASSLPAATAITAS